MTREPSGWCWQRVVFWEPAWRSLSVKTKQRNSPSGQVGGMRYLSTVISSMLESLLRSSPGKAVQCFTPSCSVWLQERRMYASWMSFVPHLITTPPADKRYFSPSLTTGRQSSSSVPVSSLESSPTSSANSSGRHYSMERGLEVFCFIPISCLSLNGKVQFRMKSETPTHGKGLQINLQYASRTYHTLGGDVVVFIFFFALFWIFQF